MNSARKTKLLVKQRPPRNPLIAPAMQRKAGAHRQSRKTERQSARSEVRRALRMQGD